MDFRALPSGPITLANVTVPACLLGQSGDLVATDLHIANGVLTDAPGQSVDMARAMVLPCFADMHAHLDKGHIWPRAANPDGSFTGALTAVRDDHANWSADDLRARMDFALRCAYAHGTRAVRTHLDSIPPQPQITWPVFAELRDAWAGRIDLQGVGLIGCDGFSEDGAFRDTADLVAEHGGVLGMVTYPVPDLRARLEGFFRMAAARGLDAVIGGAHRSEFSGPHLGMSTEQRSYLTLHVLGQVVKVNAVDVRRFFLRLFPGCRPLVGLGFSVRV